MKDTSRLDTDRDTKLDRRRFIKAIGSGTTAAALAGSASSVAASTLPSRGNQMRLQDPSGEILVVGFHQDPTSLDPVATTTAAFQSVTAATIEQLIIPNTDGTDIEPWLATEWTWVDDTTLEFKLREGVTFTNGEPFNAESAVYSIDLLLAAEAYSGYTQDIDSAEAVDDTTLRINLKTPGAAALTALARGSYMYPAKYHAEVGAEEFGAAPIGTGPYTFTAWNRGSSIEFEANPDYWGDAPKLAGIRFQIILEEAARVAALEAGEVHIITNLSSTSGDRIKDNDELTWVTREGARQFATFFETRIESPVQDKMVRRALNYAVDKQALIELFGGEATALQGQYLTPGALGYNPDVDPFTYDPEQAMSLLAEAGYGDGFETSIAYTINRYALDKEMGETVAAYLEAIGLRVTQQPMEYGAFRDGFRGDVGALGPMYQWGLLTQPDPHWTLSPYQDGSDYQKMPDDPVARDLIERGKASTDSEERQEIYAQLVAHWNDDPIGIYLIVPNDLYAASKAVTGFTPRRDQVLWLFGVGLSS